MCNRVGWGGDLHETCSWINWAPSPIFFLLMFHWLVLHAIKRSWILVRMFWSTNDVLFFFLFCFVLEVAIKSFKISWYILWWWKWIQSSYWIIYWSPLQREIHSREEINRYQWNTTSLLWKVFVCVYVQNKTLRRVKEEGLAFLLKSFSMESLF